MTSDSGPARIIVSADDFGLTGGVCRAIVEASLDGVVSNTSMMVCAESYLRNAEAHFASLAIPCGVHLQLTDGRPVSAEMMDFLLRETGGPVFPNRPDAIEMPVELVAIEWDAQVRCFIRHFGRPSHLDSHHWLHLAPAYLGISCELALRHGLPVRGRDAAIHDVLAGHGVVATRRVVNLKAYLGDERPGERRRLDAALLRGDLAGADGGVGELLTHPGYADRELESLSSLGARREVELGLLRGEHARRVLEDDLGLSIVDYRILAGRPAR